MTKQVVSESDALRAATNFSLLERSTARLRPWAATPCPIGQDADDPLHEGPANVAEPGSPVPEASTSRPAATVSCRRLVGGIRPAGRARTAPTVLDRAGTELA